MTSILHRSLRRDRTCLWLASTAFFAILTICLPWPVAASGQSSDADVRRVAENLRCVVCEHQSVAESNAELAGQMREIIRQQLSSGRTEREIMQFFVERYGDTILYTPPRRGFSLLAWLVPVMVLLGSGSCAVIFWLRRRRSSELRTRPFVDAVGVIDDDRDLPDLSDLEIAHYQASLSQGLTKERRRRDRA